MAKRYAAIASSIGPLRPFYTYAVDNAAAENTTTIVAVLVEHPRFELGPPDGVQVSKLFQQVAATHVITEWRRATASYARLRGLQFAVTAQDLAVTGPGFGRLRVLIDDRGRAAKVVWDAA